MASEEEEQIATNKERVGPMPGDCYESLVEVVFAACIHHVDHTELESVRACCCFSVCDFGLTEGIVGIDEIVEHGGGGYQLAQQLQSFPRDRRGAFLPLNWVSLRSTCGRP